MNDQVFRFLPVSRTPRNKHATSYQSEHILGLNKNKDTYGYVQVGLQSRRGGEMPMKPENYGEIADKGPQGPIAAVPDFREHSSDQNTTC